MIGGLTVRNLRLSAICALVVGCALAAASSDDASSKSISKQTTNSGKSQAQKAPASDITGKAKVRKTSGKRHKKSSRVRGQLKIDSERTQEIQEALIREHYLRGEATGKWNDATEAALRRFQADNGWQSKTVPDSRALIKLGLGPSKDHLLNPDSAMTTIPDPPRSEPVPPTSHSTAPAADPATPAANPASNPSSGPQ